MTGPTRPTDEAITAMLVERSAVPMPIDLRTSVLERVREVRNEDVHRGRRPGRTGPLLIAAALAVAGIVGFASLAGSRRPPPPTSIPSTQAPAVALASPSERPTTPASAASQGPGSCPSFDQAAGRGGEGSGDDPVPGPAPSQPANGPVVLLAGAERTDPNRLDPFADSPSPAPFATWGLDSLAVNGWNPSSDGTVVAAELGTFECPNDVFVMRIDGTGLRRPFSAPDQAAFAPAWSPDGARLAVVTAAWSASGPVVDPPPSVLHLWDPATGQSTDLGRPCERCSPVGQPDGRGALAWSPDSSRIAVDYTDLACGLETPAPDATTTCRGIAVVSVNGVWNPVAIADGDPGSVPALVGWLDDATLLIQDGDALLRVDAVSGTATPLPSSLSAWVWPAQRALSPDHTTVLNVHGGNEAFATAQDVLTGKSKRIEPIPPDVLDFTWSPDSKWILAIADTDGFGANLGLYLGAVDGSTPARRVLPGGFGNMGWLQAP